MLNQINRLIELLQHFDRKLLDATGEFRKHFTGKDGSERIWLCAMLDEETSLQSDEVTLLPAEFQEDAKLYFELDSLCNQELIASNGDCNWGAHRVLGAQGYRVVPGEQDSFGWLTGIIIANNFRFSYG